VEIKQKEKTGRYGRAMWYSVGEWSRIVTVGQDTDIDLDADLIVMESPKVNWSALGSVDAETAIVFADMLALAAKKAKEWDADTGKDCTSVLTPSPVTEEK
jgi:hypothetical protein